MTFRKVLALVAVVLCLPLGGCSRPLETKRTPKELNAVAVEFVRHLAHGKWEEAWSEFGQRMFKAVSPKELKRIWEGIILSAGPWQEVLDSRFEDGKDHRVVYVKSAFEKGTVVIKVVYDAQGKIDGMWLEGFKPWDSASDYETPEYAEVNLFSEIQVTVGEGRWALPGTLSMPSGEAVPGVVLVHGSGPNDRDETLGSNKPFKDLAWGLATRGIAVLRYEKRTKEHPEFAETQEGRNITVKEETVDDAVLAVDLLRKTSGIDPDRVFVLGHSLGGTLAPRIAQGCEENGIPLAGLILMAAASRDLLDIIPEQIEYLASLSGTGDDGAAQVREVLEAVRRIREGEVKPGEMVLGAPLSYWDDLASYHAVELAKSQTVPMLLIQGERDYQVTTADFDGWKQGLADREGVTFKSYPDLNHLFMEGTGKSTPDEYLVPSHVNAKVIRDIEAWIKGEGLGAK